MRNRRDHAENRPTRSDCFSRLPRCSDCAASQVWQTSATDDSGAREFRRRRDGCYGSRHLRPCQTRHSEYGHLWSGRADPAWRPRLCLLPDSGESARKLPLVFLHGTGQFSKTWETTPDGREGFQNIFLRRRFPVYLIDQPRRGNAGRSTVSATIAATPDEQMWFGTFRVGIWPNYFPGVQFSKDPEALNQYFRQMTPNVGTVRSRE